MTRAVFQDWGADNTARLYKTGGTRLRESWRGVGRRVYFYEARDQALQRVKSKPSHRRHRRITDVWFFLFQIAGVVGGASATVFAILAWMSFSRAEFAQGLGLVVATTTCGLYSIAALLLRKLKG